jgi:hypothetical protein
MSHKETINGTQVEIIGSIGLCGGREIFEVRTIIDGMIAYYEEAASKDQMIRWCKAEIRQCRKELS